MSVALTALVGWLLLREFDFNALAQAGARLPAWGIVAAFLSYAAMNAFRVVRFRLLFREVAPARLAGVTLVHNLLNNLIPFRAGEFSFVWMMRRHAGYERTVSALIVFRILDLIVIALLFVAAALLLPDLRGNLGVYGWFVLGIGALAGLAAYGARFFPAARMPGFARKITESLAAFSPKLLGAAVLHTAGIWIVSLLMYFVLCDGIGLELSWLALCVPITLVRVANVLPVSGFAGFGTTEGAWVIGMLAVGLDYEPAVASGLLIHVLRLVFAGVLGAVGYRLLRRANDAQL